MIRTCITVGTFDGVHLGHQWIIGSTLKISEALGLEPRILVLNNPPKFNGIKSERYLITTEEEKMSLLRNLAGNRVDVLEFTKEIEEMDPEDFIFYLKDRYRVRHLVLGFNHTFGKEKQGNVLYLLERFEYFDLGLSVLSPVKVDDKIVSSTLIRELLKAGDVKTAAKGLGRFYSLSGVVTKGKGLARELGFRTINLEVPEKKLIPKKGVYAVLVSLGGKNFSGACYIGDSPTLGLNRFSIEVHLIGFEGELYGEHVDVSFVEFLRDDIKFNSPEELKNQISSDIVNSHKLISQLF